MTDWNKDRIAEGRKICEAVPAGPYGRVESGSPYVPPSYFCPSGDAVLWNYAIEGASGEEIENKYVIHENIGQFLCYASEALPAAIDEIERCHKRIAELEEHGWKLMLQEARLQGMKDSQEAIKTAIEAEEKRLRSAKEKASKLKSPPDIEADLK